MKKLVAKITIIVPIEPLVEEGGTAEQLIEAMQSSFDEMRAEAPEGTVANLKTEVIDE